MMESFGADLIEQLRRNLGDAFQAVSGENLDWGALLVQILGQLLVSVIYLGVFLGVYLILIAAIRLGLGERRTKTPLYIQMRSGQVEKLTKPSMAKFQSFQKLNLLSPLSLAGRL